jgi:hypothetical protein
MTLLEGTPNPLYIKRNTKMEHILQSITPYHIIAFFVGVLVMNWWKDTKTTNDREAVSTLIQQNKEFVHISTSIEIMKREIAEKEEHISSLDGEIDQREDIIARLLQRAEYVRNTGDLAKYEEIANKVSQLNSLKETLGKIKKQHEDKFNIGIMVQIIQDLFYDLHQEELDILGVSLMVREYWEGQEEDEGSDEGGKKDELKPTPPKRRSASPSMRTMS